MKSLLLVYHKLDYDFADIRVVVFSQVWSIIYRTSVNEPHQSMDKWGGAKRGLLCQLQLGNGSTECTRLELSLIQHQGHMQLLTP